MLIDACKEGSRHMDGRCAKKKPDKDNNLLVNVSHKGNLMAKEINPSLDQCIATSTRGTLQNVSHLFVGVCQILLSMLIADQAIGKLWKQQQQRSKKKSVQKQNNLLNSEVVPLAISSSKSYV
jgi:hypothetical protein